MLAPGEDWSNSGDWMWDPGYGWATYDARAETSWNGGMHEQVDYQAWKHYPEQALQGYPPYHWQAGPTLPMPSGVPSLEAKPKMFEPNAFNHASKLSASTTATGGGLLEDEVEARPQLPHGLLDDDDDDIPAPRPGLGQSGRGHELLTPGPPLPLQAHRPPLNAQLDLASAVQANTVKPLNATFGALQAHAYAGALSQVAGQPPHVSPSQAKAQQLPQQPLQAHHMPRMPQHTVPQQQMSQPTQHSRLHASGTNPTAPSRTHQVQMAGSRHGEQISVATLASLWTKPSARGEPIPQGETTEEAPGITVGQVNVSGVICTRATWKIEDVRDKLQATLGRPLVSPPFRARGLPNLRLMVFPDAREAAKGVRQRERKGLYATMVKKGPVHGSLCLKADCLQDGATVLCYNLTVGKERRGPFTYDYKEKAVNGCEDFGIDWLKEIDDWEALDVGVEILDVIDKSERPAYPLRAGQRSWQDGHFRAESYENYAAMKLGVIQRDLFAVNGKTSAAPLKGVRG